MLMEMEIWMSFVGVSMSLAGIPQAYRMWKRKTSDDISLLLWLIMFHGIVWWLIYGLMINSLCLIITNIVSIIIDIVVIGMIIKYRRWDK